MNHQKGITIDKTFIPNSIIIFTSVFLISSLLIIINSEKPIASVIYPIVLSAILFLVWTFKSKYDCIIILSESEIKFRYFHPSQKNSVFALKEIKSNIKVERYNGSFFIGGFPTIQDYLNYRWYFHSEEYIFSFLYGDHNTEIRVITQPNLIGLKSFLDRWIKQANVSLEESEHHDSVMGSAAKSLIHLVVRNSIGNN